MKTQLNKVLAAVIVMAVLTFVAISFPSLLHNIMNDIITKR